MCVENIVFAVKRMENILDRILNIPIETLA